MRRRSPKALLVAAAAALLLLPACSSTGDPDDVPLSGTLPAEATTTTTATATTAGGTGGDAGGDTPEVVDLQVPTEVPCTGDTARVTLTFETADADQVAFLVDQRPVQGGPNPPVSGSYEVGVPCDGNAHTILMAAVGPGGQALASRAFRTVPSPG